MARVIKPEKGNRAESVQAIWKQAGLVERERHSLGSVLSFDANLAQGRISPAIGYSRSIALDAACTAIVARWNATSEADVLLRRAFALFYWHVELDLAERSTGNWSDVVPDDAFYEMLNWQGLAAACGEAEFSNWIALHLCNLFLSGGVIKNAYDYKADTPGREFTEMLQVTLATRRWPDSKDVSAWKAYGPLLTTAHNPASFAAALVDYCDYRVAQCLGYDGIDAVNRRRPSQYASILDLGGWSQSFPLELFTLKLAYEQATGGSMNLNADHPLLQTSLMTMPFPGLTPLHRDELVDRVSAFYVSAFADRGLRQPITLRYPMT
ncbi:MULTISPECIES: hypothetical protein [Variovorax]|uniref:Uncharacterized protein n=1 Tax=Variovorax paradoxus (strain EPS) TaxID=595537 RepID=E6V1V2_VARPE|nr:MULTISPECIES: hypothetical protein [Variovorax]ADU37955.1 hypothetical protein Varpa_3773 [Variovorax paradoxus EPS]MDQ0607591.1 hypothetical protein [Variovorax sp. W1I1]